MTGPKRYGGPRALICAVCDIRGFSLLTSRVHEFVNRVFPRLETGSELEEAYRGYVEETQNLAKRLLLEHLGDDQEYALKATGDGYLVALGFPVPFLDDRRTENEDHVKEHLETAGVGLLAGVRQLVEQAHVKGGKEFGLLTTRFIDKWGEWIGIHKEWLSDGPELRVAGALTVGTGILYPGIRESIPVATRRRLDSGVRDLRAALQGLGVVDDLEDELIRLEKEIEQLESPEPSVSYGDAFGESVNLAFRLCAEAGRPAPGTNVYGTEKQRYTPYILMDRRFAGLVHQRLTDLEPAAREGVLGSGWELRPFGRSINLKGLEESWCYALVQGGPQLERIAFVKECEIFR